jgi:hypothetical protein
VRGAEGVFSHFVARSGLARQVAEQWQNFVSTDDQNFIEYGFARTMSGVQLGFNVSQVRDLALKRGDEHPEVVEDRPVDWQAVEADRWVLSLHWGNPPPPLPPGAGKALAARVDAYRSFLRGDSVAALQAFRSQNLQPLNVIDDLLIAEGLANLGDAEVLSYAERRLADQPVEADVIRAEYFSHRDQPAQAAQALERAFTTYRTNPWAIVDVMQRGLRLAQQVTRASGAELPGLIQSLAEPFAAHILEEERRELLLDLTDQAGGNFCLAPWHALEPNVPWTIDHLVQRRRCYANNNDPLLAKAEEDLKWFVRNSPQPFLSDEGGSTAQAPGVSAN